RWFGFDVIVLHAATRPACRVPAGGALGVMVVAWLQAACGSPGCSWAVAMPWLAQRIGPGEFAWSSVRGRLPQQARVDIEDTSLSELEFAPEQPARCPLIVRGPRHLLQRVVIELRRNRVAESIHALVHHHNAYTRARHDHTGL